MRRLYTVFIILLILNTLSVYALSEEKCIEGGGVWTEKIGCDQREGDTCPQFYCKCHQGFSWNENLKQCTEILDQVLCESSDGEWIDDECVCPKNSIGFKENFGCDYALSLKEDDSVRNNNLLIILLVGGIILLILLIILATIIKNKRK